MAKALPLFQGIRVRDMRVDTPFGGERDKTGSKEQQKELRKALRRAKKRREKKEKAGKK